MAGLVAIISHDRADPVPADDLALLVGAYRALRGGEEPDVASPGPWAQVARIDGAVRGRADVALGGWMQSIGAIHADGDLLANAPEGLDGQFAAIRYEAARDELSVIADPFGMQALYVCEQHGRTYASTSSAVLARHLRLDPEPAGLHVFLRAGYQFGPLTPWAGVERVDPGTVITFAPGGRARTTYWQPTVDEQVRRMSFARTVDHCLEAAFSSIDRWVGSEPCVWADLTGGYDSRLTTTILRRLGVPLRTATSGEDASDPDVSLAAEVARRAGFQWQHDRMPDGWSVDDDLAYEAVAWGDGGLEILQLGEVLWRQREKAASCGVVVTGGGGEHASARPWVQEFLRAGRSRQVNYDNLLRMRYLHPVDLSILRHDPSAEVDAYFRARLGEREQRYADELNTTKLDVIYAYKSTGHFGAYRSASEAAVRQEIPFYYRDFFSACFSAHHRWRNGHRLQRAMIERTDRRVAGVQTTLGGPAARKRLRNLHEFTPYYTKAARAAMRKLRRSSKPHGPNRAGARRSAVVQRLRRQGVLEPETMRTRDLYDVPALEAFLDRAEHPGFSQSTLLGRVITVELLLRAAEPSTASPRALASAASLPSDVRPI